MRELTILFDGETLKIDQSNGNVAEAVIILNEALSDLCESLDKPVEQALAIAYSMYAKGELFKEEGDEEK